MRVFGIDPGSTVTGYGCIERQRGRFLLVDAGCVRTDPSQPMCQRLDAIYGTLREALGRTNPDSVAIEAIFRHRSSESALRLGQARGVALLAAGQLGFEPVDYNNTTIKQTVGAHGRADKHAIRRMVETLLGQHIDGPADVTDALAIAITHATHARRLALERSR